MVNLGTRNQHKLSPKGCPKKGRKREGKARERERERERGGGGGREKEREREFNRILSSYLYTSCGDEASMSNGGIFV